jgi:hypothetical protein
VLILGDYKDFDSGDYETLRFQAFEIWPGHPRNRQFVEIMTNYYHKLFLVHRIKDAGKTPAPKNFWPDAYQFYVCNPIRTFLCEVTSAYTAPRLKILEYVEPGADRENIPSIGMPRSILKSDEVRAILDNSTKEQLRKSLPANADVGVGASKLQIFEAITSVSEELRASLPLRDTDHISVSSKVYKRRTR